MKGKILLIGLILSFIFVFSTIATINASDIGEDAVQTGSSNIKAFTEKNGQLPNYVTISNKKYSMDQYLYISSNFILVHSKGKGDGFCYDYPVKKANKPTPRTIKANIDKETFYDMALRTSIYIQTNKKTPSLIGSKYGDVQFQTAIYAYAKIIDYYKKNKVMPNYVTLNVAKTSKLANYMPKF